MREASRRALCSCRRRRAALRCRSWGPRREGREVCGVVGANCQCTGGREDGWAISHRENWGTAGPPSASASALSLPNPQRSRWLQCPPASRPAAQRPGPPLEAPGPSCCLRLRAAACQRISRQAMAPRADETSARKSCTPACKFCIWKCVPSTLLDCAISARPCGQGDAKRRCACRTHRVGSWIRRHQRHVRHRHLALAAPRPDTATFATGQS